MVGVLSPLKLTDVNVSIFSTESHDQVCLIGISGSNDRVPREG